jgi:hypothetical protein
LQGSFIFAKAKQSREVAQGNLARVGRYLKFIFAAAGRCDQINSWGASRIALRSNSAADVTRWAGAPIRSWGAIINLDTLGRNGSSAIPMPGQFQGAESLRTSFSSKVLSCQKR